MRAGCAISTVLSGVLSGLVAGCGSGGGEPPSVDAGPPDGDPGPTPGFTGVDDFCPGSAHCAGDGDGKLYVGFGTRLINPTIVESEWVDENTNNHYDSGEPFTDTNGNGVFDATWIAGYGNGRPATGFHPGDALEVRAIAFRRGDTTIAIAILDAVGYFIDDAEDVKARPELAGVDVDHIIVGSSHLHEGVDTVGLWGQNPLRTGLNAEYQALTHERAAQAIADAVAALRPATMRVAQKQTINPDDPNTTEYVSDTRDPVIYDPTMTIVHFVREEDPGTTIGTLINWSSHPESAGSRNNLLTADFVHNLRFYTEEGLAAEGGPEGLGGTTVFVNGALGGQVGPGSIHVRRDDGTFIDSKGLEMSDTLGKNLARFALQALEDLAQPYTTDLVVSYRTAEIYAEVMNSGYHALYLLDVFDRQLYFFDETRPIEGTNIPWVRSRITAFQVGPIASITAPGELHPELWVGGYDGSWSFGNTVLNETVNAPDLNEAPDPPYLRDLMLENPGVEYTFVCGLCEDFLGYIVAGFNYELSPDNPYFEEAEGDHYEETNSIGPLVEEQIQHPMIELAKWRPE